MASRHDTVRGLGVARVRAAYEQVADQLRTLITTGSLTPGDRLPSEAELGQAFGVSRSTVREALRSLTTQNLIYTSRGVTGGSFVTDADPRTISDYLETSLGLLSANQLTVDDLLAVRDMLEVPAARLAATQRSPEELDTLRSAAEQEATGSDRRHEHPQQFHILMLSCSHNSLLELVTQPIFSVLKNRFLRDRGPTEFWYQVRRDHLNIVEAVTDQDSKAAATLMQNHLGTLRETYLAMDRP
jgi:DNA-binding FadR family transcriptional regulator